MVEQLCEYFGLGSVESFRSVAFQAHFGGVGRITRATPKYRRVIKDHVLRVRGLVALEQADGRGVADPPTNEAAAHGRDRPLHLLGGSIRRPCPSIFSDLRFLQVSNIL
jgi:hypothetical protein